MQDTPRNIYTKFDPNWSSSFRNKELTLWPLELKKNRASSLQSRHIYMSTDTTIPAVFKYTKLSAIANIRTKKK